MNSNKPLLTMLSRRGLIAAMLGLFMVVSVRPAAAASDDDVLAFTKTLGDAVVELLADQTLTSQNRTDQLITLLDGAIDLQILGKAVLARHWRTATEIQREEYLGLFRELAVAQVSDILNSYSFGGETYEIGKIVNLRPDRLWSVHTTIIRPDSPEIALQWVVLKKKTGDLVLFDVKAEEFSLVNTKRDEFGSVVSRHGIDGLIDELRQQVAAL